MTIETEIERVRELERKFQAHVRHLHATETVFYLDQQRRLVQKSPDGVITVLEEHPITAAQLNGADSMRRSRRESRSRWKPP